MVVLVFLRYIYWAELDRGIYRLDLARLSDISQKESVVSLGDVRTFLIDPSGYQVIYPYTANDSILSSFLDGSSTEVLRYDEGHSLEYFTNVSGIVYYNDLFVWTRFDDSTFNCLGNTIVNAPKMYSEVTPGGNIQESLHFTCARSYHGLDIYHPLYQPIPAPVAPPVSLQVLFSDTTAEMSWNRIAKLDSTGN